MRILFQRNMASPVPIQEAQQREIVKPGKRWIWAAAMGVTAYHLGPTGQMSPRG